MLNAWIQLSVILVPFLFLGDSARKKVCNGTEDIKTLQTPYTDTSQLRISNMVYKAVYAIAHAIHNALCQGRNVTAQCDKLTKLQSKQVSKNESVIANMFHCL